MRPNATEHAAQEAQRVLDFLAFTPNGVSTVERPVLRAMLLSTDGYLTAQGHRYEIKTKHLGAGVYRVRLGAME